MYSYDPIPTKFIRVVEIHSGQFDDDIAITLHPELFEPAAAPSPVLPHYEALSYTWGSKDNPGKVQAQGVADCTIEVTRNLEVALRHLRQANQSRLMWIDAVCIDQSNNVEKGPQVGMMGDIYRFAQRVVVWLGPEENNSDNAMWLMGAIGAEIEVDFDTCEMKPSSIATDLTLGDENATISIDEEGLCSLYHLFCRSWFERLWIRQELGLANERSVVVCGCCSVLWQVFRRAWACFYLKPKPSFKFSDELTNRNNSLSGLLFQEVERHLPHLRESFGNAQCSDPRDRIYALLSLDKTMEDLGIVPDYSVTATQLYENVTKLFIDRYLGLEILTECEMACGVENLGGPSWVPDWSVGNPYILHLSSGVTYASGPFVGPRLPVVDHRLRVIGVPFDTIQKLDRPLVAKSKLPHNDDTQMAVKQMLLGKDLAGRYVGGGTLLDAYVRTFTLDQFAETYSPATTSYPGFAESTELMTRLIYRAEGSPPIEDEERLMDRLEDVFSGRLLLETRKKYIGLVPPSALPGDKIYVILGCSLPMILRPADSGHYNVVGACYVCGLNDGEAVLGPMPQGYRFVQMWDGEGYVESFINEETGEALEEDPRLETWPTGDLTRFMATSGSISERIVVDLKYLRDRGINATYIELV